MSTKTNSKEITVLNGKVRLLQPESGFKTSIDSVLLAAACPAAAGQSVLDLGCGVASAGLCVLRRVESVMLHGIDIQEEAIDLAARNAALNTMEDRCSFVCASVSDYAHEDKTLPRFDHIIANPPYMETGTSLSSPHEQKDKAHMHSETDLEDWVSAAFQRIKGKGSLTMIHRADQTAAILQAMGKKFGAIEIIPLWPRAGESAKRVIIRAYKHRQTGTTLHAGLVLHETGGEYTPETNAVLRDGNRLF